MSKALTIVCFRTDLRLDDNPALHAAAERGPILPVFIHAPEEEGDWTPGAASRWWLHHSLNALDRQLQAMGSRLIIRRGPTEATLQALVQETGARAVFWNRRYEPAPRKLEEQVKSRLKADGCEVRTFNSALLFEPWEVATQNGNPYKVFTPFWKRCMAMEEPPEPLPCPTHLAPPATWPATEPLAALQLEPAIDWAAGLRGTWTPGAEGAYAELARFADAALHNYAGGRDRPDVNGTSRLSPHLHFGEISPRAIWHTVRSCSDSEQRPGLIKGAEAYLRELGWREFACHLLYAFPHTTDHPLRPEFADFPWQRDADARRRWQQGQTGFPIVDAGMRQLWQTGWMHNRVRMIVASFLVKDLLLPWQEGTRWFWDTLVDADLASNTLGWQWTAGCGADAAPFFRVFNPVTQGTKFDPQGDYVRRFVPELASLPSSWIHRPWEAPATIMEEAGIRLGSTYPKPMVDHGEARQAALAAYDEVKGR